MSFWIAFVAFWNYTRSITNSFKEITWVIHQIYWPAWIFLPSGFLHLILNHLLEIPLWIMQHLPPLISTITSLSIQQCKFEWMFLIVFFPYTIYFNLCNNKISAWLPWVYVYAWRNDTMIDAEGEFDLDETMDMARQVEEFLRQPMETTWSGQQSWPLTLC